MAKQMTDTANATGMQMDASSHTFTVPADVCNRCHSDARIHASGQQQRIAQPAPVVRGRHDRGDNSRSRQRPTQMTSWRMRSLRWSNG